MLGWVGLEGSGDVAESNGIKIMLVVKEMGSWDTATQPKLSKSSSQSWVNATDTYKVHILCYMPGLQ